MTQSLKTWFSRIENFSEDPLERARRGNYRFISVLILALCLAALGTVRQVYSAYPGAAVTAMQAILAATAAFYVYVFFSVKKGTPPKGMGWAQCTIDMVTLGAMLSVSMVYAGPSHALTNSAVNTLIVAVALTALRLEPWLSVYSAGAGIAVYLTIYTYADTRALEVAGNASTGLPNVLMRCFLMFLMGAFGFVLARTLRREIARARELSQERDAICTAFGRYVDAGVVDRVMSGDLKLSAEYRTISVLFVDIRNFTQLSESGHPGAIFRKLSETLDAFSVEVQREGGIVNKFLGDGLMAIFGAPVVQHDHARRAVNAALQIEEAARIRREDGRFPELFVGIGVHCGQAVVGDLGGERREYTAIGDVVNVASRVEAANKELGTNILITDAVMPHVGTDVTLKPYLDVALKGRAASVDLYQVRPLSWSFDEKSNSKTISATAKAN